MPKRSPYLRESGQPHYADSDPQSISESSNNSSDPIVCGSLLDQLPNRKNEENLCKDSSFSSLTLDQVYYEDPIIPVAWFHHLHLPSGAPDTYAILIIADIVRWYYPKITLEGSTQRYVLHPREPYHLLQKSYQEFATLYGISKPVAIKAVVRLEEQGLVKRIFTTLEMAMGKYPNVLNIELNSQRLQEISKMPLGEKYV